jgi:TonB-linked SusC/RagA family outer membrane protein
LNLSGYSIKSYANPNIGWEIAAKSNLGLELGLFDGKVEIQADFFKEHRTNILMDRSDVSDEMGLWSIPKVNIGEANGKGVDVSVDYKHNINRNWWLVGRANFTYAHSVYDFYEESDYAAIGAPWKLHAGQPVSQKWGYIAERLFIDDNDVANSARQEFGQYGAGDIKYKDMNNDGVINTLDQAPIGYPSTPEINYGFGLSAGYKNFDLSVFFSGSDRSSFWIDAAMTSPFVRKTIDGNNNITTDLSKGSVILEGGLAQFIADDHWTEQAQNPYARWPRLSNVTMSNNTQRSTWFMYDNSFLRLKSAEIGYSLPKQLTNKFRLESFRIYVSGTNLLMFSNFKIWDVEMGGNGLNYPLQRVINLGINLTF